MQYLLRLDRAAPIFGIDLQPGILAVIDTDHSLDVVEHALRNPQLVKRDKLDPEPVEITEPAPADALDASPEAASPGL